MSAPFDTRLIEARLKELCPSLRLVGTAAYYAAVKNLRDFQTASAYVLRARESGGAHGTGRQRAEVVIGIAIAARNYRDQRGATAGDDSDSVIKEVREALMGWTPPVAGGRPVQWVQGDLLDYDDATTLWMEVFQTQHFIGKGQ